MNKHNVNHLYPSCIHTIKQVFTEYGYKLTKNYQFSSNIESATYNVSDYGYIVIERSLKVVHLEGLKISQEIKILIANAIVNQTHMSRWRIVDDIIELFITNR